MSSSLATPSSRQMLTRSDRKMDTAAQGGQAQRGRASLAVCKLDRSVSHRPTALPLPLLALSLSISTTPACTPTPCICPSCFPHTFLQMSSDGTQNFGNRVHVWSLYGDVLLQMVGNERNTRGSHVLRSHSFDIVKMDF